MQRKKMISIIGFTTMRVEWWTATKQHNLAYVNSRKMQISIRSQCQEPLPSKPGPQSNGVSKPNWTSVISKSCIYQHQGLCLAPSSNATSLIPTGISRQTVSLRSTMQIQLAVANSNAVLITSCYPLYDVG